MSTLIQLNSINEKARSPSKITVEIRIISNLINFEVVLEEAAALSADSSGGMKSRSGRKAAEFADNSSEVGVCVCLRSGRENEGGSSRSCQRGGWP